MNIETTKTHTTEVFTEGHGIIVTATKQGVDVPVDLRGVLLFTVSALIHVSEHPYH